MRTLLKFIAIGSIFAAVEEFLTVVLLRGDWGAFIFTVVILFPVFLTLIFFLGKWMDRRFQTERAQDFAAFLLSGAAGLMIEWFLIGLSPWSNPDANWILMILFQAGMFSFWATVGFAPRLFLKSDSNSRKASRQIRRFYASYFLFVYLIAFTLAPTQRFAPVVCLIVLGYWIVCAVLIGYLKQSPLRSG